MKPDAQLMAVVFIAQMILLHSALVMDRVGVSIVTDVFAFLQLIGLVVMVHRK